MIEPRFGINRRALLGVGGAILIAVIALTQMPQSEPPLPATPIVPDPNAPAYPVDLARPPENVGVVALSEADLTARGITREKLGDVDFPSGAIVAADPLVQPQRPPLRSEGEARPLRDHLVQGAAA